MPEAQNRPLFYILFHLSQEKCKMDSFIFPQVQGQGHATLGHVKQAPWS